jgi:hypothetical protein
MLHVLLHANLVGDNHALETRVFELSDEHGVDFVGDFFADTFVTVIDGGHGGLRKGEDMNIMNCFLA